MSGGAVMVYQTDGASYYVPLPITQNIGGGVQEHDWFVYYPSGSLSIFIEYSDNSDPNPPTTFKYKLVCIPPAMKKPNVNMNSYADVKAAYNLKD